MESFSLGISRFVAGVLIIVQEDCIKPQDILNEQKKEPTIAQMLTLSMFGKVDGILLLDVLTVVM